LRLRLNGKAEERFLEIQPLLLRMCASTFGVPVLRALAGCELPEHHVNVRMAHSVVSGSDGSERNCCQLAIALWCYESQTTGGQGSSRQRRLLQMATDAVFPPGTTIIKTILPDD
jgi:hypothetical protein